MLSAGLAFTGAVNANTVSANATPLPSHVLTVNATGSSTTTTAQAHAQGTVVNLAAVPSPGFQFMGWGGACSGNSPSCAVTMAGARTVNAQFGLPLTVAVTGTGAVTSAPAGIQCGSDCTELLAFGTNVTLTATPSAGQAFGGWGGACTGTAPTCTVAMGVARNVTAAFVAAVAPTLNLSANPATVVTGGTTTLTWSSTGATACTASGAWSGSRATSGSFVSAALSTNTAYTLTCTGAGGSVSRTANVTVSAPSTWTRIAEEGGSFTVTGTQTVRYGVGTSWVQRSVTGSGTCSNAFFGTDPAWGIGKVCEVLSGSTANTFVLSTVVNGSGSVSSSPAGINCGAACNASFNAGASVTLTATPAGGQAFNGWSGACSGTGTCTVAMTAARSVTAAFGASTASALYFSDCQPGAAAGCLPGSNANPGTQALPKRTLDGINVNALPGGTSLLFARGGSWIVGMTRFENMNASATAPITLDAYGTGPAPLLTTSNNPIAPFELGGDYFNTSNDGGYVFRNLRIQGTNNSAWGFWLNGNVHDVVIENVEISGFEIGIHSQARAPHGVNNVRIRNSSISRNNSMGILGSFSNALIEGNLIEANNASGSGFNHGSYLSGTEGLSGRNVTLRNNRYIRNSVVNGTCTGGNMTFHGQMDGVLIEGNRIEQDAASEGCWEMSITQGYASAEWFRNFVVRNNKLINAGNTGMAVQSAPGILIEGNVIINTRNNYQTAITVGLGEHANGDAADGNAVVRNNTACYPTPAPGSTVVQVVAPNSQLTNNVMLTGAAATTGVCVR